MTLASWTIIGIAIVAGSCLSGVFGMAGGMVLLGVLLVYFDVATGMVTDSYTRWVIYTPGATPESTGLPTTPGPGAPWLMFPGTPGAHIMISPARPK